MNTANVKKSVIRLAVGIVLFIGVVIGAATCHAQEPAPAAAPPPLTSWTFSVDGFASLMSSIKSNSVISVGQGTDLEGHRGIMFEQHLTLVAMNIKVSDTYSQQIAVGPGVATLFTSEKNTECLGLSVAFKLFKTPQVLAKVGDALKPVMFNLQDVHGFVFVGEPADDWLNLNFSADRTIFGGGLGFSF